MTAFGVGNGIPDERDIQPLIALLAEAWDNELLS
jgi:hypothetical protein